MKNIIYALIPFALFSNQVFANTESSTVEGVARMNSSCSIQAANLNFGVVNSTPTGNLQSSGNIALTCTKETSFTISFDGGNSTDPFNRNMIGETSSDTLRYNLYKDTNYTQILGDGNSSTYIINDIGSGEEQQFSFYGRLPLNQYKTPDNYSDNITVFLNY